MLYNILTAKTFQQKHYAHQIKIRLTRRSIFETKIITLDFISHLVTVNHYNLLMHDVP
jgi:hypothetical protein